MADQGSGRATVRLDADEYHALLYRVELLEGLIRAAIEIGEGRTLPHAQVRAELLAAYG